MACDITEEQVWKCQKHPSRKQRNGICPACLRDRLGCLCPKCAKVRPCACVYNTASSSSSSSSSFSFFNTRASNSADGDPSLRRSRSVSIPFLRSGSLRVKTSSFLSGVLRNSRKAAKEEKFDGFSNDGIDNESFGNSTRIEEFATIARKSRLVSTATAMATGMSRDSRRADTASSPAKWKLWQFPSPMKVFRSSKTPKEPSPYLSMKKLDLRGPPASRSGGGN